MTQRNDQTTGGTGTVSLPQEVTNHLETVSKSPTEFQSFFRAIVGRASQAGVSQQQLLDSVSDSYGSSRQNSGR